MCQHAFVAITLREKLMRERRTNMRERCSRYAFILDISSLDVLTLNSSSTQILLVFVLSIRFPRPVLLHSG